jgi:hypothetical protein
MILFDLLFGKKPTIIDTKGTDKGGMNPDDIQEQKQEVVKMTEQSSESESSESEGFNLGSLMNFLPLLLILPMIMNMFSGGE